MFPVLNLRPISGRSAHGFCCELTQLFNPCFSAKAFKSSWSGPWAFELMLSRLHTWSHATSTSTFAIPSILARLSFTDVTSLVIPKMQQGRTFTDTPLSASTDTSWTNPSFPTPNLWSQQATFCKTSSTRFFRGCSSIVLFHSIVYRSGSAGSFSQPGRRPRSGKSGSLSLGEVITFDFFLFGCHVNPVQFCQVLA